MSDELKTAQARLKAAYEELEAAQEEEKRIRYALPKRPQVKRGSYGYGSEHEEQYLQDMLNAEADTIM